MSKIIEVYSKGERYEVIVDDDVIPPKNVYKKGDYFYFAIDKKNIYLHRWIMGVTDKDLVVDHINNDHLNNTRDNLRICKQAQNNANRRCKGYTWHKQRKKWQAQIKINGRSKNLGGYDTPEEAQQVYRKAHAEAFGEFSPYYNYDSGNTEEVN